MLKNKKPNETIYIVPSDKMGSPFLETVEKVGTIYITTVTGRVYRLDSGIERVHSQVARPLISGTRAWASEEEYLRNISTTMKLRKLKVKISKLTCKCLSDEKLNSILEILET